ncbi:MAG: uroporphyrinogen-III synthase, partial [Rhabdaerophilum sp.]
LVSWLRYRMEDAESLPEAARQALVDSQCDAILHFSRESVATLLRLVGKAGLQGALHDPIHACLSPAIAQGLRDGLETPIPPLNIVIAPERNAEALIQVALVACREKIRGQTD